MKMSHAILIQMILKPKLQFQNFQNFAFVKDFHNLIY